MSSAGGPVNAAAISSARAVPQRRPSSGGEQRADDPAGAHHRDQHAHQARLETQFTDQEDHQDGLVAGQPDVAGRAEDREHPQVRVPGDEAQPLGDVPAQRSGPLRPAYAWFAGADAQEAHRGDQEAERVQQQRGDRTDELGDQTCEAGSDDVARGLGGLELRVALRQLLGSQQHRQVDLVGGFEEDPRDAGAERHHQQLRDGEPVQRGGQRHAEEGSAQNRSQTTITGRRGSRSTHAPAGRPISSQGSQAAAVSTATWKVPASRTATATRGSATVVTLLPTLLTAWPAQSSRKSRCRSSPPAGRTAVGSLRVAAVTVGPARRGRTRRPAGGRRRRRAGPGRPSARGRRSSRGSARPVPRA